MTRMSVSEARAALPDVLDRVLAGEEITITRHGQAVAVVVRPDRLKARRGEASIAEARRIGELLESTRSRPLPPPSMDQEAATALIEWVRASRDAG